MSQRIIGAEIQNQYPEQGNRGDVLAWSTRAQNELARQMIGQGEVRNVQRGDTLGALVKGLNGGSVDYGMRVDYRSSKLTQKPTVLREADLIYPGQYVWIKSGTVIVADQPPAQVTQGQPNNVVNTAQINTVNITPQTVVTPAVQTRSAQTAVAAQTARQTAAVNTAAFNPPLVSSVPGGVGFLTPAVYGDPSLDAARRNTLALNVQERNGSLQLSPTAFVPGGVFRLSGGDGSGVDQLFSGLDIGGIPLFGSSFTKGFNYLFSTQDFSDSDLLGTRLSYTDTTGAIVLNQSLWQAATPDQQRFIQADAQAGAIVEDLYRASPLATGERFYNQDNLFDKTDLDDALDYTVNQYWPRNHAEAKAFIQAAAILEEDPYQGLLYLMKTKVSDIGVRHSNNLIKAIGTSQSPDRVVLSMLVREVASDQFGDLFEQLGKISGEVMEFIVENVTEQNLPTIAAEAGVSYLALRFLWRNGIIGAIRKARSAGGKTVGFLWRKSPWVLAASGALYAGHKEYVAHGLVGTELPDWLPSFANSPSGRLAMLGITPTNAGEISAAFTEQARDLTQRIGTSVSGFNRIS